MRKRDGQAGDGTGTIGVAVIGAGSIALANHLPGLALHPAARLVAVCDRDPAVLERARAHVAERYGDWAKGLQTYEDPDEAVADPNVSAVIVATPNVTHAPIVHAALRAGMHVLCEKPLAMNAAEATEMLQAAEAANVRHMTAFTYRFVPAMRYLKHLVDRGDLGRPIHFRAQRFQDWGDRGLGWRQLMAAAGSGELGDMLSHRIDYGHLLVGPIARVAASMGRAHNSRGGQPSDVDDWVAVLADFDGGTSGVLESTKLATGVGEGYGGRDVVEINGDEASAAYSTQQPLELKLARRGESELRTMEVPPEFRVWPGSGRDPSVGDPRVTFRYDQAVEFIGAIVEDRACRPSFVEGVAMQRVMEAIQFAAAERRWVDVPQTA